MRLSVRTFAVFAVLGLLLPASDLRAQLTIESQFNPSGAASLCGLAFDAISGDVWVFGCFGATVQRYSSGGTFLSSVARPGESANDVDVEISAAAFTLGATSLAPGTLLFVNGETGPAEVYALDKSTGATLATLNTLFGVGHVVGGAYHATRNAIFLVQDNVPGATDGNRIAEINPATGAVVQSFQTSTNYSVNFGDLEVCASTGNLLLVSSAESSIGEFTPDGAFVATHSLPAGVSSLSGIGLDEGSGEVWVAGTGGLVWRLGGAPCAASLVPALPGGALPLLALLLLGAGLSSLARSARTRGR